MIYLKFNIVAEKTQQIQILMFFDITVQAMNNFEFWRKN